MKAWRVPGTADEAARKLLDFLVGQGRVRAAFTLAETSPGRYACSLITDRGLLGRAAPTVPVMPANGGKMVSRLTLLGPVPGPVAVVLRPCELRALVELGKLEQARLDDLLLVSFTCAGVAPTRDLYREPGPLLERHRAAAAAGANWDGMRDTCRACELFEPAGADITLELVGGTDAATVLAARTPKGEQFLEGFAFAEEAEDPPAAEPVGRLARERAGQRPVVLDRYAPGKLGLAGLVALFGRCINCHACSKACPACYCSACHFESADAEQRPDETGDELARRGAVRVPPGTVHYHVGRMLHVGMTCVGCGMCSDACPVDIPVATVFTRLAGSVQGMFDYVAGRDAAERIPTTTFETEELEEIGA